jgi:hypothetical protein
MNSGAAAGKERRKAETISALKPFNAGTSLVLTLSFLIIWRVFYACHFFRIRPIWIFIEDVTLWAGILGTLAIVFSMTFYLKRKNWIRFGSTRFWMKTHVVLGLAGPVLIEIHGYGKNYGIAGWAALLMWIVALSGFVGLYLRGFLTEDLKFRRERILEFHGRIEELHWGLAEQRVVLLELQEEITGMSVSTGVSAHEAQLQKGQLARNPGAIFRFTGDYLRYLRQTYLLRRRWLNNLRYERNLTRMIARHTSMTLDLEIRSRTSGFVNELFALWRLVHIPMTTAFVITLLIHLWAVWNYR